MNTEPITCISRNGNGGWLATSCAECEAAGGTCSEQERPVSTSFERLPPPARGGAQRFDRGAAIRDHLAYLRQLKRRIPAKPVAWSRRMHRKVDRMIADAESALPEAALRRALDTVAAKTANDDTTERNTR